LENDMTLTEELIELIESKPITDADLEAAAWLMLDGLANTVGGTNSPQGRILTEWFRAEPADLNRTTLWLGGLMHILEVDDLHRQSVVHPGCVVIPAAVATGLREGASGRQLLEAVLKGFEACTRLGNSVGPTHYRIWHNTATCGPFGGAYAAGSLLKLNAGQLRDALGNAGTQSSGLWEFLDTGAMSKHLHAGRGGQAGALAAELAKLGFTGPPAILEGERGFYAACCPDADPRQLLAEAEGPWQLHHTSIKPWPCCRHTHPAIDAALELSGRVEPEAIRAIEVGATQAALNVCDRPTPESLYDAKFSLQHCAAIALLDGKVEFDAFDPPAIAHTQELRAKVRVQLSEVHEARYPEAWGGEVAVQLTDGTNMVAQREHAKGDPDAPVSPQELREKAAMLLRHGGVAEPEPWVERLLRLSEVHSLRDSGLSELLGLSTSKATLSAAA